MAYEWFISYRRKTGGESQAQKVAEILSKYVGKDKVFYDRVSMREGNWRDQINDALNSAEHFVLLVNEASAAEDQSNNIGGYRYEINYALNSEKLKNNRITIIAYDNESYKAVTKEFSNLSSAQKVTYYGEYAKNFEERLCDHFGFVYQTPSSAPSVINNISYPGNLIPRRDMLNKLNNEFKSHKCVVVSGIGGSGKTSLAYLYAKEQNFNNIAWVIVNGKIEDVFVDRIARLLFKNEDYEGFSRIDDVKTKLDIIKSKLSKIEGKNLLVFDINTNNEEIKQEIETKINNYLPSGSWKTLVLTRTVAENPSRFSTIKMDKMAADDANELFLNNWKRTKIVFSQDQLAEITKELYYHPLLIEQTAIVFSKGYEKSADDIISKIKENSKVNNPRTKKILSGLVIEDKEMQDIYTYLINLCNIENLSPEEINFLAVYVTWPDEPIDYEVISTLLPNRNYVVKQILGKNKELKEEDAEQFFKGIVEKEELKQLFQNILEESDDEKAKQFVKKIIEKCNDENTKQFFKEIYEKCKEDESYDTLDLLVEKGIISRNDNDQYSIHSLIADVIREQIDINEFDYTEYLESIVNVLNKETVHLIIHKYSQYIYSSFIKYEICNDVDIFTNFVGLLYYIKDPILYNNIDYSNIITKLSKKADTIQLLHLYNAIARIEECSNKSFEAKKHYNNAIDIIDNLSNKEEYNALKSSYLNNLALLETKINELEQASNHYNLALEIRLKLPLTTDTAILYSNLAEVEEMLGFSNAAKVDKKLNYIKSAKQHYEEGLNVLNLLNTESINMIESAKILNNLGLLEFKIGKFKDSKKHFIESIAIRNKLS
ncbi:MAG: TIR domain-containing protein, partial [Alphaproteobacteria bacterium]|nr:TIR domain-containing protein [Alphaproteobacteria bacterium]